MGTLGFMVWFISFHTINILGPLILCCRVLSYALYYRIFIIISSFHLVDTSSTCFSLSCEKKMCIDIAKSLLGDQITPFENHYYMGMYQSLSNASVIDALITFKLYNCI